MKKLVFLIAFIAFVWEVKAQKTGTFRDNRDGHVYKTVKIGKQWWMAENLAYKPNRGNYWAYDNKEENRGIYGYLYDWETAKLCCPSGWHLPSIVEFRTLIDYLGGETIAGKKLKATTSDTQKCGFNALPAGARDDDSFEDIGAGTMFWSTIPYKDRGAWVYCLDYDNNKVDSLKISRLYGVSVRCIKD